ncbi:MAG: hypothetical protein RLZZ624_1027 [Cyanobacteriota bacterium]|jgi:molecular chaperone DnaJ
MMGTPLPSLLRVPRGSSDPYTVLGVGPRASAEEIKAAYRALVKRHHPDAGGDATTILALNAAWEVLGDPEARRLHDRGRQGRSGASGAESGPGGQRGQGGNHHHATAIDRDSQLLQWLQQVYNPIDRLLAQVINPFPAQLRELSADPYDDQLMEAFCTFLEQSRRRLETAETLYRSQACPAAISGFSLSLYHCFRQVQDAVADLERYTLGYVDSYLRDGRELLREAKRLRSDLHAQRRQLELV